MQAGKLAVQVHSASGSLRSSPAATESSLDRAAASAPAGPPPQLYVVCELLRTATGGAAANAPSGTGDTRHSFGRLCTEPRDAGAGPDEPTLWEQELTFEVGPSPDVDLQLHAAVYAVTPEGTPADDFIAGGSMSLAHLRKVHTQRSVRVPLVSGTGSHLADLSLDLRFFHSRNPAWQRDSAGREYIDSVLAEAGPTQAARMLNERSPRSPTASPRPGSPRIKPPSQDPPVPELPTAVRTMLAAED